MTRIHVTRSSTRLFAFALVLLTASVSRLMDGAAAQSESVRFRWAVGAWTGPPRERVFKPLKGDAVLHSGDELKLFVSPTEQCYVYVLLHDSRGNVTLLFPETLRQFDQDYVRGGSYYVPPGADRYALDKHTGTETLHILAAPRRLQRLEGLLTAYDAANAARRPPLALEISDAIRDLKRRQAPLQAAAERPAAIAGRTRGGAEPDLADVAIEVAAADFYSRTLTVEHR